MSSAGELAKSQQGCVGEGDYTVKQGDCMSSIAHEFGYHWRTLWNLPENFELRRVRKDPNALLPGDKLTVPPLREKFVDKPSDALHKFVKKGCPAKLSLVLNEGGEPLAGEDYILNVDGVLRSGTLDPDGRLEEWIPPGAKKVQLIVGDDDPIDIRLGAVDPITEVSGVQGRLANLGINPGPIDGIEGPRTRAAVRAFQDRYGLDATSEMDAATRDKLVKVHGC